MTALDNLERQTYLSKRKSDGEPSKPSAAQANHDDRPVSVIPGERKDDH